MRPSYALKMGLCFLSVSMLAFGMTSRAYAQTREAEARKIPSCEFTPLIESLQAIKLQVETASGTEIEALLTRELETRKALLGQILLCALIETQTLRGTTDSLPVLSQEGRELRSRFSAALGESATYYEEGIVRIPSSTLPEIKALSAEIKSWREETYLPLAERTGHFILWTQNQELIDKARTRLSQARQTIINLKLTNSELVQNAFNNARTYLLRSEELHERAEQSLTRGEPAGASLGYMKTSLGELYRMYEFLFTLSDEVRKALAR